MYIRHSSQNHKNFLMRIAETYLLWYSCLYSEILFWWSESLASVPYIARHFIKSLIQTLTFFVILFLPSFRQRYSRIMRVGGVLFYEKRALIAATALAINRSEHIVRRTAPIFWYEFIFSSTTRIQTQPTAKIKIIRK